MAVFSNTKPSQRLLIYFIYHSLTGKIFASYLPHPKVVSTLQYHVVTTASFGRILNLTVAVLSFRETEVK